MQAESKFYITHSNLRRLSFSANIISRDLTNIYEEIFNRIDLSAYISQKEAQHLISLKHLLEKSEAYLIALKQSGGTRSRTNEGSPFIFTSGAPKYHKNEFCGTLTRDFENFKVPDEVVGRGPDAVEEFRDFARENRRLINEGREDVFILRLKSRFGLKTDIDKVSFTNSGRALLNAERQTVSLESISSQILAIVERIEHLRGTESGAKAFQTHRFAPPSSLLKAHKLGPDEQKLLELKGELIDLVTEFVIRRQNPAGSLFSRNLLEVYGFGSCKVCCETAFKLPGFPVSS